MRNCFAAWLLFAAVSIGSAGSVSAAERNAVFNFFRYEGKDVLPCGPDASGYRNPVLAGFYPDPSICRRGDDYFMVTSTFSYFPGIPIFHSTDLVNWKQIGHVLDRSSQLNLDGIRLSGGIYAPDISYDPATGTFYVVTTCVEGIGNFVVKTDDPFKNDWSDPILLPQVGGIDPSLFFDDDGKAYLLHNDGPEGQPRWDGHRAIRMHEYDPVNDRVTGKTAVVVDGGADVSTNPVWIEGPHLYKVDGFYFLIAAEGGTGPNHSEVVFRASDVWGPYEPYVENPILTQRDLPARRKYPVTSTGHADLVMTPQGDWYAVFLGCRPYSGNLYNTGRETFMLPVDWSSGYPVILKKGEAIPCHVPFPVPQGEPDGLSGNFTWEDRFDGPELSKEWIMVRTPVGDWYGTGSGLRMNAFPRSIYDIANPVYLGRRQQHTRFEAYTEFSFEPQTEHDFAGLICYQNEQHLFAFGRTVENGLQVVRVERTAGVETENYTMALPEEYRGGNRHVENRRGSR